MKYFTVLTTTGANKIAAATAANETINLTHIAVGDSNGTETAPIISQTQLINEVYRTALSEKKVDENNSNHIIASSTVPADQGNFWIREVGVFDEDGDLIAVGNYPETYKSILTQGAAKEVILRVVFEVANTEVVSLQIDPSIVMASQEFVNEKLLNKVSKNEMNIALSNIQTFPIGYPMLSYKAYDFTIVAFGGEFNRADYPKLWEYLEANPSLILKEADWQTQNTANDACGFFSAGDGSTTFRVPNLNQTFYRASNKDIGVYHEDMLKSHNHAYNRASYASGLDGGGHKVFPVVQSANTSKTGGSETRPKNITLLPLIVAK